MADQILDKVREVAEGQIDFEGQRLAEFLATALLAIVGVRISSLAAPAPRN
jgi:signal peptidase complex subunit 1